MGFVGSVFKPFVDATHAVTHALESALEKLGPFQFLLPAILPFVPGLNFLTPFVTMAMVAAKVGDGITSHPPKWGEVIQGTLMAATGGAVGLASKAMGNVTSSAKFAELFGGKLKDSLDAMEKAVVKTKGLSGPAKQQYENAIKAMKDKINTPDWLKAMTKKIQDATGKAKPDDPITKEEMQKDLPKVTGGLASQAFPMLATPMINSLNANQAAQPGKADDWKPLSEAELDKDIISNVPDAVVAPPVQPGAPPAFTGSAATRGTGRG
jgi:hypothetical protein